MFDIGYSELLLIAVVTLLVVGPKELPNLLRNIGKWTGKARSMARHFRSGFDTMVREAELEEMNKRWADQNAAVMAGGADLPPDPEADFDRDEVIPEMASRPDAASPPPPSPLQGEESALAPSSTGIKTAPPPGGGRLGGGDAATGRKAAKPRKPKSADIAP